MINVELGHLGVTFDCELLKVRDASGFYWSARTRLSSGVSYLIGEGKSPALAIEALRKRFHQEEK